VSACKGLGLGGAARNEWTIDPIWGKAPSVAGATRYRAIDETTPELQRLLAVGGHR
jgi:hypothetical protein